MHWIFPIFYNAIKKYIKCQELFLDTRDIAGAWGLDEAGHGRHMVVAWAGEYDI